MVLPTAHADVTLSLDACARNGVRGEGCARDATYKLCFGIFDFSGMKIKYHSWYHGGPSNSTSRIGLRCLPTFTQYARECRSVVGEPLSCRFLPNLLLISTRSNQTI